MQRHKMLQKTTEANLANTSVLIKVKFFANVEAYPVVFRTAFSEADKRQFDRHVGRTVLWDPIWSQTVRQRYQTVHAFTRTELRLYFIATGSRLATCGRASHHLQPTAGENGKSAGHRDRPVTFTCRLKPSTEAASNATAVLYGRLRYAMSLVYNENKHP